MQQIVLSSTVVSRQHGTRRVITVYKPGKLGRQKRIDMRPLQPGQIRLIAAEIKKDIGIFHRQGVAPGITPLLPHFISHAPHEYARMITIPQYKVYQITLVPTVEIASVIISGFLDTPHVKCLVHYHEAHTVAKIEQFGCGRIMRTTNAVTTHRFQYLQLSLYSTNVNCSPKTA